MEPCEDCDSDSPQRKKVCDSNTPVKLKSPVIANIERLVKVSNLPPLPKFMEISFCKHVEKARRKAGIAPEKDVSIIKAFQYSKTEGHVFLEFAETDIANQICKIKIMYLKHNLILEAAVYDNDTMIADNQSAFVNVPEAGDSSNSFTQQMRQLSPFGKKQVKRNIFDQNSKDDYNMDLDVENLTELIPVANSTALECEHENIIKSIHTKAVEGIVNICELKYDNIVEANQAYDVNRSTTEKMDKSCKVLVGNLPTKLFKDHFLEFINDMLREMLGLFHEECAALSASDPTAGSTIVEFRTVEEAQAACLIDAPYGKRNLTFQHLPKEYNQEYNLNPTCKVQVGNLPQKFFKDHFLEFVNDELRESLGLSPEENAALSVSDPIANSTIVEFRTVQEAQAACLIDVPYGKTILTFKHLQKECKMSCKVLVRNLPKKLFKDHFLEFFNDELRERLGLPAEENPALSVSDPTADSTIVEFRTVQEAHAACSIDTPYGKYILELKQLEECDLSDTGAVEVAVTPINDVAQEGETVNLNRKTIKLKSHEGDMIFLRALVQFRRLFLDRNNHSSGYARVVCALDLEGVSASIPEVTSRRKHFLDIYNKKKKLQIHDYLHSKALLVIFGDGPIELLNGTEYCPTVTEIISLSDPSKVADTAAIFSKGAVFNKPASLKLISIIRANLDVYRKLTDHDPFWIEVSNLMKEEEHYYTPSQCERRFLEGQKLYRNEGQRLQRTGQPTLPENKSLWFMCDDMAFIMENDVTVKPPLQIACGSSNIRRVNTATATSEDGDEDIDDPGSSSSDANQRIGKARLPTLKRPRTKNDGLLAIAAAMNRRTTVLENRSGSK